MKKHKIGWCSTTFNPVWGCLNNCEYCYARRIANFRYLRMIEIEFYHYQKKHPYWVWTGDQLAGLKDFELTFLEAQYDKKFPKKPQRIFVGSMSEIYYWEKRWVRDTLNKVLEYPQHTFQFLTKFPDIYSQWYWHPNCWLGVTITKEEDFKQGIPYDFIYSKNITFLSIEPILEHIDPSLFNELNINWVIIGAETGNRKDKVIPKKEWVLDIIRYCVFNKIPYYLKDNLSKYYGGYRGYKQFPIEVKGGG